MIFVGSNIKRIWFLQCAMLKIEYVQNPWLIFMNQNHFCSRIAPVILFPIPDPGGPQTTQLSLDEVWWKYLPPPLEKSFRMYFKIGVVTWFRAHDIERYAHILSYMFHHWCCHMIQNTLHVYQNCDNLGLSSLRQNLSQGFCIVYV